MNSIIRGRHGYREKIIHLPIPETHWKPPLEKKPSGLWNALKYLAVALLMGVAAYLWFHGPGRQTVDRAADAVVERTE